MTIDATLQQIDDHILQLQKQRENVLLLGDKLKDFPHEVSLAVFGEFIDIEHLDRAKVVALISHLKSGKWDKTPSGSPGKIDYVNTGFLNGAKMRIWAADPPPSCKLVEEQVEIPAQPARIEKRLKLVCKEHELAAV
jgi:hypothetical protein